MRKPYLIGIAGPSGAGKSFLAEHLAKELGSALIFPIDAYYPDLSHLSFEKRNELNFDDPDLLDTTLLFEHVRRLARGESIQQPIYDFARHTRIPQTTTVAPSEYIIIEGLFTLHWPELRKQLHTRVYIDLGDPVCLKRRIARDVCERGRKKEYVEHQFRTSVVPMADLYVRPSAAAANVTVLGNANIADEVAAVLAHIRQNV